MAAHRALDLEFVEFELRGARHQSRCVNSLEGPEGQAEHTEGDSPKAADRTGWCIHQHKF